jgi:hypothetical protein
VFGIWLALERKEYSIWDGWVLVAIVLWAVAMGLGGMGGKEYDRAFARQRELAVAGEDGPSAELAVLNRTQRGAVLHAVSTVLISTTCRPDSDPVAARRRDRSASIRSRAARPRRLHSGGGSGLLKASMVLSLVLLAAYLVAVWAMSSKPV